MLEELNRLYKTSVYCESDKQFIKESYYSVFGEYPKTKTKCSSCWHDAIIQLLVKLRENKFRMLYGATIRYKGTLYNHKNITDAIALEILKENPNSKSLFYGL